MNELIQLRGARGFIAKKMRESLQATAQLSFHASADAQMMIKDRKARRAEGQSASFEDFVICVLARLLPSAPLFNGVWVKEGFEPRKTSDISIAIAASGVLMTPTIFDAAQLDVEEISRRRQDLIKRSFSGGLSVKEQTGGSFTISNLGRSRVEHFTPILNYPQSAILGVGRVREGVFVDDEGVICTRSEIGLSLTADHALIDGAPASAFLTQICTAIESGAWREPVQTPA